MGGLLALQVVTTGITCGFYRCAPTLFTLIKSFVDLSNPAVPLLDGQGCIAGPKHKWVGVYWVATCLLYSASVSQFGHIWDEADRLLVRSGRLPLAQIPPSQAFEHVEADAP